MMDFMTPHAILIKPDTYDEIIETLYMDPQNLRELYAESIHANNLLGLGMRTYIVAWRDSVTGLPRWESMSEVELACEYRLKTVNQFWQHFTKI